MSITYAVMAIIASILLLGYCLLVRKKEFWLLLLYVCVLIVNIGYFFLSISQTVKFAILSNDLAYLGSTFLSMCMFLTIVRLCGFPIKKKLVITLTTVGVLMFAIIATSGILPWYYKEVSLAVVDGATKLEKVYGVLHPVYLVYLIAYFTAMIVCILQSVRKKKLASQKHATLMAGIVFGNIAVWLVEKFIPWEFEFLSVSYLFSEIVFLGLSWMMQDYVRISDVSHNNAVEQEQAIVDVASMPIDCKVEKILLHIKEGEMIAPRERQILELILANKKRKDIAVEMCLSENTIKTYTRTLYAKIGVTCREEINALLLQN